MNVVIYFTSMVSCKLQVSVGTAICLIEMSKKFFQRAIHNLIWQKKSLLTSKRPAILHLPLISQLLLTDLAPSHLWGLLQLHRADPSAAPDKIVNCTCATWLQVI
jgi:hypothetical protein